MSIESTEQKIKKIICDHYLSGSPNRLTVKELSARANISRQAFHKSYLHLKAYITGSRNIDELLLGDHENADKTIIKCQKLIRECQAELWLAKEGHQKEFKELEDNLVTTLMSGDVLIHHSRELTNELRKKALHNEILKRQLLEKDLELSGAADQVRNVKSGVESETVIFRLQADIREAVARYSETLDLAAYYSDKSASITKMKEKLQRILKKDVIRVVVFQNRFISSFEKFVERNFSKFDGSLIVVDLPLAARSEIRDFVRGLTNAMSLELYVPYSDSEAVIKAQRGFSYGQVPVAELRSFDKESLPTIQDGFDSVTVYRIAQGE
jgi:hypothetical protein